MKKGILRTLLLVVLLVLAVVLGKVVGDVSQGVSFLSWLGLSAQFGLQPSTLDLAILQVNFGLTVDINVAQAIWSSKVE